MNQCIADEVKSLDSKLNSSYTALMRASPDARFKEALRSAQRAWIADRDASCAFEGGTYL